MRIANVNVPDNKRIVIALTYISGIGNKTAQDIIGAAGIDPLKRTKDLTEGELTSIRESIQKMETPIEGDLRREVLTNIRRLKDIKSYRGNRHARHLPVRGQRSKTNNRTVRGNVRKTMGSGRAPSAQKT